MLTSSLDRVRGAVREMRRLELELADAEELAAAYRRQLGKLKRETLPDLMVEAGVTSVGLPAEGNEPPYEVALRPYFKANVAADWPEERRRAAFRWLEENGHGDVVKREFLVQLGRGEGAAARRVREALDAAGVTYAVGESVPWQTLTALVRHELTAGRDVPLDTLGAEIGQVAEVKKRKEK